MRKTRIALAVAAASMLSSPVFATNGDHLIGVGVQSRALGGTGTAAFFGSENALTNPALLGKTEGTEFAIGGTLFMPDVKVTSDIAMPGMPASATSDADTNVIPAVSMATRIDNNWTFGMGMYGTAGMGVDYRGNDALFNATTNLQLMKFVPTMAYNQSNFGFGFAPVLQYGALDINWTDSEMYPFAVGDGVSTDLGWGFNLGGYFDVTPDLTVGLAYNSAIEMEYDNQLTTAADSFGVGPNTMGTVSSNKLEQPAEIKAGVAYTINQWMLTADYKLIKWSSASGYKDFNWDDQDVFGIGAKFDGGNYWVGFGYNYGKDPIKVLDNTADPMETYSNQAVNLFNNHFFPAVVESHFTVGGGYRLNNRITLEGAVVYADEVSKTIDTGAITTAMAESPDYIPTTHTVKHSQLGVTVSMRMNF